MISKPTLRLCKDLLTDKMKDVHQKMRSDPDNYNLVDEYKKYVDAIYDVERHLYQGELM